MDFFKHSKYIGSYSDCAFTIVFATDCVDRFSQTIPSWIDMGKIYNFIYKIFAPVDSFGGNLKYLNIGSAKEATLFFQLCSEKDFYFFSENLFEQHCWFEYILKIPIYIFCRAHRGQ